MIIFQLTCNVPLCYPSSQASIVLQSEGRISLEFNFCVGGTCSKCNARKTCCYSSKVQKHKREISKCIHNCTFSSNTKQLSNATHCWIVRSLNTPLKIISVSNSSSPLQMKQIMRYVLTCTVFRATSGKQRCHLPIIHNSLNIHIIISLSFQPLSKPSLGQAMLKISLSKSNFRLSQTIWQRFWNTLHKWMELTKNTMQWQCIKPGFGLNIETQCVPLVIKLAHGLKCPVLYQPAKFTSYTSFKLNNIWCCSIS